MKERFKHFFGLMGSNNLPPLVAIDWSSRDLSQRVMVDYLERFENVRGVMLEIMKVRNKPVSMRASGLEHARKALVNYGWWIR